MAKSPLYRGWLPQGWDLEITYKPIRNIWFRVDPRQQRFRISAPSGIRKDTLNRAIRSKAGWMAERAARPAASPLIPERLYNGDVYRVWGRQYTVGVQSGCPENGVVMESESGINIRTKGPADPGDCARMLAVWYRQMLNREIPELLTAWEPLLGVRVNEFRIRKMKTRWGSCNTRVKRVWINLALACLDPDLLEYVLVHEMLHLLEPSHNQRFYRLMDKFLPDWQERKSRLSSHGPGLA